MNTLYSFGDSFSYGYNLKDKNKSWPNLLSQKLNLKVINLAYPGGSNWRIARELFDINPHSNDLVVIGWTVSNRFEFGKNPSSDLFKNKEYLIEQNVGKYPFANNKGSKTQSFFSQITERAVDSRIKLFSEIAYNQLYNEEWFDEMFRIFYWASRCFLERKNVKWLMFDTWCPAVDSSWKNELQHENYKYLGKNNIDYFLSKKEKNVHEPSGYWNEMGHEKISNLLLQEYNRIYG